MVFTGDEFADGGLAIRKSLSAGLTKASFFLTGRFYRNEAFKEIIDGLKKDGHYLGAHSDQHLLYCDWKRRDSLLVTKKEFTDDLKDNYKAINIQMPEARFFLPPYEWYNDTIASWTTELGLRLINYTPGIKTAADYTTPGSANYRSNDDIWKSIWDYEGRSPSGLNGFIILIHIGTDPLRTEKFYDLLPGLISRLKMKGYRVQRIDEMLK